MIRRSVLIVVSVFASVSVVVQHIRRDDIDRDLYAGYRASQAIHAHTSMYHPLPERDRPPRVMHWLYSPQAGAAVSLLPRSLSAFSGVWASLLVASWWVCAWSLARLAGSRGLVPVVTAAVLLAVLPGAALAILLGNADPMLWAAAALAVAAPVTAGPALAFAGLLKTYAALPLAAALFRRDRKTLGGAAATVAAATLLAAVVLGPARLIAETRTWVFGVLPVLAGGNTLGGTLGGTLIIAHRLPANLSITTALGLPSWLSLAIFAGAPIAVAWIGRRWDIQMHYAATIAVAVLAAPLVRLTYLPALLPLAAMVVRRGNVAE